MTYEFKYNIDALNFAYKEFEKMFIRCLRLNSNQNSTKNIIESRYVTCGN